jgi:UDP-2,3-diacylglucosamine pyrophosphatase LpxH
LHNGAQGLPEEAMNALIEPPFRFRAIWISDVHLGTKGCNAELLLDFLRSTESDYLYLVGDIVDLWRLRKTWYWRQEHNDVIQKILRKARKGTRVVYIPGNHDENFRSFAAHRFGRVAVLNDAIHTAADGKRYLVLHGDQFDGVVKYAKWLAFVGDNAYQAALAANLWFNTVRRRLGFSYWSLSAYLKHKVKNAVEYIGNFEAAVVAEARRRNVQGVICGHIHTADIRDIDGITYANDGDWVESCTALVEHADGRLEILRWATMSHQPGMTRTSGVAEAPGIALAPGLMQSPMQSPMHSSGTACTSSSLPTPGLLRSMASFARSRR